MANSTVTLSPKQFQAMLNRPAGTPPPGIAPNFQNPPNLNVAIILAAIFCGTTGTILVIVRMYTKVFLTKKTAYEDYAVLLGWISQVSEAVIGGVMTKHGGGFDMWNIRLRVFSQLLYWVNIISVIYDLGVFFVKLSILLQYLRIFVPTRKGNMILFVGIQVCIWSNFIFYLSASVFRIAMCSPREKIWQPWIPTGHCYNSNASYLAAGFFNVVSDFAILILPFPCLWKLQMPLKRKILLTIIFATGFFACVVSVLRTYYTFKVYQQSNVSYNVAILGIWTEAELTIGIIVSCLPVVPRFFQHFGPKVYETLSFWWNSGSTSGRKAHSTGPLSGIKSSWVLKLPFSERDGRNNTSVQWTGPWSSHSELNGEHMNLEQYHSEQLERNTFDGAAEALGPLSTTTRRDDLEAGKYSLRVVK